MRTGGERRVKTAIVDEIIDRIDPIAGIALQWQPDRIGTDREHQRAIRDDPIIQYDGPCDRINPSDLALRQNRGLNCLSRGRSRRRHQTGRRTTSSQRVREHGL